MADRKNEFQSHMEQHLINFKENQQYLPSFETKKKWQYYDSLDNIYPPVKHGFLQYAYDNAFPLHDYINHVRSSQAFAVNLFFPLLIKEKAALISLFNNIKGLSLTSIDSYHFEYSLPINALGEWHGSVRPEDYVTAADVAVFLNDKDNKKYAFIIEVKFTESGFTSCGGYTSNGNKKKEICKNRALLTEDYDQCYLQTDYGRKKARLYFNYFKHIEDPFPGHPEVTECPFISNHQCIRNHSIIKALMAHQGIDKAFFGLMYHDDNVSIKKDWDFYYDLVASELKDELFSIKASEVLSYSKNKNLKKYFKDRYLIEV